MEEQAKEGLSFIENIIKTATTKGTELVSEYGLKVVGAVVALIVGLFIINRLVKLFDNILKKKNVDESLVPFLTSLVNVLLKAGLLITVATMVGFETTSFIALLGAAGFAVGLALQGGLSNFAAGVMILLFKPYKVGDAVIVEGNIGTIKEIQIFNTILTSLEFNTLIIPNSIAISGIIQNNGTDGILKCAMSIGISYDANIQQAREVIQNCLAKDDRIIKDKPMEVLVDELGDSSVNLLVRPWCKVEDYWDVRFDNLEAMKVALDEANISIPFPQLDVHLDK